MSQGKRDTKIQVILIAFILSVFLHSGCNAVSRSKSPRERVSINFDWRFTKNDPEGDFLYSLKYPVPPAPARGNRGFGGGFGGFGGMGMGGRGGAATQTPAQPAPTVDFTSGIAAFMLPTSNDFISDIEKRYTRPSGNYGSDVPCVVPSFDDSGWDEVDLPHDYAIEGPFITTGGGGMGRLPSSGVSWYRKNLDIPASDEGKKIFLDIDGSMSYTTVWCNGQIVGGWVFGYASWQVDLTPYIEFGSDNVLAIRLDNPQSSSRWYPGAGIYRNVWITKTEPVHVGQWGTYITTPEVSSDSADISLKVTVDNDSETNANVKVSTEIFEINLDDKKVGKAVAAISPANLEIESGKNVTVETNGTVKNPKLWGTGLYHKPNRYVAVTTIEQDGKVIDTYETIFGIRTIKFDPDKGFFLNGEHVKLNGVCNHHDLGALGTATNYRALERQFEILADMGCNAIRTSHNPPSPELLQIADKMGFLIMDEAFDVWERQKTANDYHLVFPQWHEQDLRAFIRRDRNHPSVIMWSFGNEVGEQSGNERGVALAKELSGICHEEDPTRPTINGMNSARASSPFTSAIDLVGLNYQGSGNFGNNPQYPVFHNQLPDKLVLGSETASAISTRGVYTFPVVASPLGTQANANAGEDTINKFVSSYDLYAVQWGCIPDKEFLAQDTFEFVGGEFVWTGFDYIGEPTPFDSSRSSYFGIIDLAGFKKDRFYLYQAYWRPDYPMAHILPHWTWPERVGQVTPVHVYTSGDEAELFLNGKSLGRKKKIFDSQDPSMDGKPAYRIRWDDVIYEPGELKVVAYKDGKEWAKDIVKTAGDAAKLSLEPDRAVIDNDGADLSFVTLTVLDGEGLAAPRADNLIKFSVSGPGEIVATDNGDPTDMTAFPSHERKAFNSLALVIVKAKRGQKGTITVTAESEGLTLAKCTVEAK